MVQTTLLLLGWLSYYIINLSKNQWHNLWYHQPLWYPHYITPVMSQLYCDITTVLLYYKTIMKSTTTVILELLLWYHPWSCKITFPLGYHLWSWDITHDHEPVKSPHHCDIAPEPVRSLHHCDITPEPVRSPHHCDITPEPVRSPHQCVITPNL